MRYFISFLILFVMSSSYAQTAENKITGQVIDSLSNMPLKGVKIYITTTYKGKKGNFIQNKTAKTDKDGNFKIKLNPKHSWILVAIYDGYKGYKIDPVDFSSGTFIKILLSKK